MATRGAIGLRNEDQSITAVYVHWDSYPSWVGRILLEHYDHTKTRQLLNLGALSSLGSEIGEQHQFGSTYKKSDHRSNWCTFYTRDRGDQLWAAQTFASEKEFVEQFQGSWCEFFYVLEECGTWFVSHLSNNLWQKVEDVLAEETQE
jgi:hypothetical protein